MAYVAKGVGKGATQFKAGQSGNPGGRPKGARAKLCESFLTKLLKDFDENGADAIIKARLEKPEQYLRVIASLCPKELTGEDGAPLFTAIERRIVDPQHPNS
jgi:hypothetical protein